jgi:hypothetical protein
MPMTAGESWSLVILRSRGDTGSSCGRYVYREAPIFCEDTTYRFEAGRPKIRVYTYVDPRFVIEDFISKLYLL